MLLFSSFLIYNVHKCIIIIMFLDMQQHYIRTILDWKSECVFCNNKKNEKFVICVIEIVYALLIKIVQNFIWIWLIFYIWFYLILYFFYAAHRNRPYAISWLKETIKWNLTYIVRVFSFDLSYQFSSLFQTLVIPLKLNGKIGRRIHFWL